MSDQQYVTGSALDEFADFVRGLQSSEDGAEVAERMDRWFEATRRTAAA
ncbi:hypothetical protein ACWEOH_04615 [Agromyces sp. NPDC004153]